MTGESFSPFPVLSTGRLLLRQPGRHDAAGIYILRSDEAINRYLDRPLATRPEDALAFIDKINTMIENRDGYYWIVTIKNDPSLAGTVALWNIDRENNKAEIGYELLPEHHGKDIMTEAVAAVLHFAFDQLGLSAIEAWTHPENSRSLSLLEKAGFVRDHAAEQHKPAGAKEIIYSLSSKVIDSGKFS